LATDAGSEARKEEQEISFTHAQKEGAAKALYAHLSQQFGRIPEWLPGLGRAHPSSYFGKKILSSAAMERLLVALLPIYRDILPASGQPLSPGPELALDTSYERASDFSRKVQKLELTARQRQVLSLVDGRRTIAHIIDQSRMKAEQALAILRRMGELDLVRPATSSTTGPGHLHAAPKVVVFEPAAGTFRQQLERLLRERPEPLEMVTVTRPEEVVASVTREPPRLVLLNATAAGEQSASIAAAVREAARGAATKIAAMLEIPSLAQGRRLSVAGFDAVLVKPIPYADIDALLTTGGGI
jgi:CheY-like chemotaxis protein